MNKPLAMAAAALALASSATIAHTTMDATFGPFSLVPQGGPGYTFGIMEFDVSLGPHESFSQTFSYSVTLHTDGLPADKGWQDWEECLPLPEAICAPAPTGHELAFVYGGLTSDDRNGNTLDFTGSTGPWELGFELDHAGTVTYSGTFSIVAYNPDPYQPGSTALFFFAGDWRSSNDDPAAQPVPEPAEAALTLAGLGLLGFSRGGRKLLSARAFR